MATTSEPGVGGHRLDAGVPDFSAPEGDDFEALSRERMPVRSLREYDPDAIVGIDRKLTGRERHDYFVAKLREAMSETVIWVSLVAEVDGRPAGYVMAWVDHGEFGQTESGTVIDTIGVDPGLGHHGIGTALLSQLLANLDSLRIERVPTKVARNDFPLLGFLERGGFAPAQQLVPSKAINPARWQIAASRRTGRRQPRPSPAHQLDLKPGNRKEILITYISKAVIMDISIYIMILM